MVERSVRGVSFTFVQAELFRRLRQGRILDKLLAQTDKFVLLHVTMPEYFEKDLYRLKKFSDVDDVLVVLISMSHTPEANLLLSGCGFPAIFEPQSGIVYEFRSVFTDISDVSVPCSFLFTPDGRLAEVDDGDGYHPAIYGTRSWDTGYGEALLDKATVLWEEEWQKSTDLVNLADYGFRIRKRYYTKRWTDDRQCMVRREVAKALVRARDYLRTRTYIFANEHTIVVWDAYRDYFTHCNMVDGFWREIGEVWPNYSPSDVDRVVKNFTSPKTRIYSKPGSHRQASSVDITLADKDGNLLPMGTDHDDWTERAAPYYYSNLFHSHLEAPIMHTNRILLLRESMCRGGGFTPVSNEWWHFDYRVVS